MDLGVTYMDDFSSSASILSPEEIAALLGPLDIQIPNTPSAIQVLLNQGADALAQKPAVPLDSLCSTWLAHLMSKNHKIIAVSRMQNAAPLGALPLACSFKNTVHNGLIAFDWTTAYLLIDGMLGGVNGLSIEKKPDQSYSPIEQNLLEPILHYLLETICAELSTSFSPGPLTTTLQAPSPQNTRLFFTVRTSVSASKIMLELPTALIPDIMPDFLFDDPAELLSHLSFEASAEAKTSPTSLKQINAWDIGTTLSLLPFPRLTCGTQTLAAGTLQTHNETRLFTLQGDK